MTDEELLQKNIVRDDFRDKAIERLTNYLESDNKLRKLQPTVLEDVVYDLIEDNWSGVIKRPTGSGKTIIMGEESKAIGEKTLILVHQKNSANQTRERMIDVVGFDSEEVGVFHSSKSDEEKEQALKASMLIITHSSYSKLIRNETLSYDDYPLVHVDEVHLATGGRRAEMIQNLDEQAYVQGWTATDEVLENGRITTAGNKLFGREDNIHTTLFSESVENDEIAPTRNVIFETNISPKIEMRRSGYTSEEEELIISQEGRNEAAVNAFSTFVDEETNIVMRDQKSIWYTWGVENAHNLANSLNEAFGDGYAEAISGKTPKKEQERLFESHKKGEIRALVNSDLLIEAHDDPSISISVMVRPVKSPRIAVQAGGRSARLDEDNENKIAYVFSLVDKNQPRAAIFGELVGGTDFVSWGGKYTPNKADTGAGRPEGKPLPTNGVEVSPIYKKVDVIDFFKNRDEELKSKGEYRKIPDGFLSAGEIARKIMTHRPKVALIFNALQEAQEGSQKNQDNITIEIGGRKLALPSEDMMFSSKGGIAAFYISNKHTSKFQEVLSLAPQKEKEHLSVTDMVKAIKSSYEKVKPIFNALQEAQEESQKNQDSITIEIEGRKLTIPSEEMGNFRDSRGHTNFYISDKNISNIRKSLGKATKIPNNYFSSNQFSRMLGTSPIKMKSVFDALQEAQEGSQKGEKDITISVGNQQLTIPSNDMGVYNSNKGSNNIFSIDGKHKQLFKSVIGLAPQKDDRFYNATEMSIPVGIYTPKIKAIYESLQEAQEESQKGEKDITISVGNQQLTIPTNDMGVYRKGSSISFNVDKKHAPQIKKALEVSPPKPEGYLSRFEMVEETEIRIGIIAPIYKKLQEAQEGSQKGEKDITISVGNQQLTIPSNDMGTYGGRSTFCVDKSCSDSIKNAIGRDFGLSTKTENNFTAGGMSIYLKLGTNNRKKVREIFNALQEAQEGSQKNQDNISIEIEGRKLTIPSEDMGNFINKTRSAFMIHKKHAPAIAKVLGKEFKQENTPEEKDGLQSTEKWADKVDKKSIKPESEDLKPNGRKR